MYVEFLFEFDGYHGKFGNYDVHLLSRNKLMQQTPTQLSQELTVLEIGKYNKSTIVVATNGSQASFGFLHIMDGRYRYSKEADTFYLLLKWLDSLTKERL